MEKIGFFKVEGDKINRIRRHCPKCGPAVFLADHKNRFSCGKCGYTEFKGGGRKQLQTLKVEEIPVKRPVQEAPEGTPVIPKDEKVEEPPKEETPPGLEPSKEEEKITEEAPKDETPESEQHPSEEETKKEKEKLSKETSQESEPQ